MGGSLEQGVEAEVLVAEAQVQRIVDFGNGGVVAHLHYVVLVDDAVVVLVLVLEVAGTYHVEVLGGRVGNVRLVLEETDDFQPPRLVDAAAHGRQVVVGHVLDGAELLIASPGEVCADVEAQVFVDLLHPVGAYFHAVAGHAAPVDVGGRDAHHGRVEVVAGQQDVVAVVVVSVHRQVDLLEQAEVAADVEAVGRLQLEVLGRLVADEGAPVLRAGARTEVVVAAATAVILQPDALDRHVVDVLDAGREAYLGQVQDGVFGVILRDVAQRQHRREGPLLRIRAVGAVHGQYQVGHVLLLQVVVQAGHDVHAVVRQVAVGFSHRLGRRIFLVPDQRGGKVVVIAERSDVVCRDGQVGRTVVLVDVVVILHVAGQVAGRVVGQSGRDAVRVKRITLVTVSETQGI